MSSTVRLTSLLGFLVLALSACGGSPPDSCDTCTTQEAEQQCGPNSGCDDPDDPPTTPILTAKFYMQMWNATDGIRKCMYTYSYTTSAGTATGVMVASEILAAGERRTGYITVPKGTMVATTSGCWHPDSVDSERAVYSTNRTVDATQTCLSAYSFVSTGPVVEYPCWYGLP